MEKQFLFVLLVKPSIQHDSWLVPCDKAGAAHWATHTMGQTPQHQQYLYRHKSLTTSPGGDGDGERVEQPAHNTEVDELCRDSFG